MQIEALFSRQADAWRMYVRGWRPPMLAQHLDEQGEAFPVTFDADELEAYMWRVDAPYEKRPTPMGGLQVAARGRSAVMLLVFLEDVATRAPT